MGSIELYGTNVVKNYMQLIPLSQPSARMLAGLL